MTPTERLLQLHVRLTGDSSNAFETPTANKNKIVPTEEGRAWLRDYHEYAALYKSLNERKFAGTGPADALLEREFGCIYEPEEPEAA